MIGRDDPGAVRFALDIAREPSHRLQAPHMRFGKSIGGGWIMPQMCIDRIAPAIGGGDFGDGAIDLADAMLGGRDRNDRAIVRRPASPAPAELEIVRASEIGSAACRERVSKYV